MAQSVRHLSQEPRSLKTPGTHVEVDGVIQLHRVVLSPPHVNCGNNTHTCKSGTCLQQWSSNWLKSNYIISQPIFLKLNNAIIKCQWLLLLDDTPVTEHDSIPRYRWSALALAQLHVLGIPALGKWEAWDPQFKANLSYVTSARAALRPSVEQRSKEMPCSGWQMFRATAVYKHAQTKRAISQLFFFCTEWAWVGRQETDRNSWPRKV